MSLEKEVMLRALGAEIVRTPYALTFFSLSCTTLTLYSALRRRKAALIAKLHFVKY